MLHPLPAPAESAADDAAPPVILRGSNAGLEIVVDTSASVDAIGEALAARLAQSPGFFAGNDVSVRVDGRLPAGALARLEEVASRFELSIVEVGPPRRAATAPAASATVSAAAEAPEAPATAEAIEPAAEPAAQAPEAVGAAEGSGGQPSTGEDAAVAAAPAAEPSIPAATGPRLLVGPIRSGAVLDAPGDLVIIGDVNPGAEILARGNIIVLGRLRGVAHAAVGGERGFIFALRFEPQQLRVGTLVARPGDADSPGQGAEIAYATGRTIVVERYQGKIPI